MEFICVYLLFKSIFIYYIMSDRSRIIHRPGRVFEIVGFWQILLVNPPLQQSW